MEGDKYFDINKIKTYDWPDLNGKKLKIVTAEDSGFSCISGVDEDTGIICVIATKQEVL